MHYVFLLACLRSSLSNTTELSRASVGKLRATRLGLAFCAGYFAIALDPRGLFSSSSFPSRPEKARARIEPAPAAAALARTTYRGAAWNGASRPTMETAPAASTNIDTIVKAQIVFLLSTLTEDNYERHQASIRQVSLAHVARPCARIRILGHAR
jgi:hypothetical protein